MSTDSSARLGKFAREIAWSAVREDPLPVSSSASVFVPITLPIANASTTKASHPKMAVLRCRALQWPARAARVLFGIPGLLDRGERVAEKAVNEAVARQSRRPVSCGGEPHRQSGGATHS